VKKREEADWIAAVVGTVEGIRDGERASGTEKEED
jgi:hypothetical protein